MTVFERVRLVRWDPAAVSEPIDLLVGDDGRIAAAGPGLAAAHPEARKGGSGGLVSPGLVLGHTHFYSALARGLRVDIAPSKDFAQQLEHLWWRLDRALDDVTTRWSGVAGAMDAAACGVTTVIDHHASPEWIDGSLSVLAEGIGEVGVRSVLCYETTDRNGEAGAKAGVRENERFAEEADTARMPRLLAGGAPLFAAMIGAHAPFTLEDGTLDALGALCKSSGRPLHVHVAEDKYDAVESRARRGLDPLVRLDRHGCLPEDSIVAHGLWLSPEEFDLLEERGAMLAHNARSNMNNAVGYQGALPSLRNWMLGTDGMGADVLEEFKFAFFKHKDSGGPLWPDAYLKALGRAGNFAARMLGVEALELVPGAPADLVHWDYPAPTALGADNLAGHLAFGLSSRHVKSVMVGGRFVIENKVPAYDAEALAARCAEAGDRLWKRMTDMERKA